HHVGHALAEELWRQRHITDLGHAGVSFGAAIFQHHHTSLVYVECFIVDPRVKLLNIFENDCAPAMLQQVRAGGGQFDDRSVWRQIAAENGYACIWFKGARDRKSTRLNSSHRTIS